jgi:hypothetical protein
LTLVGKQTPIEKSGGWIAAGGDPWIAARNAAQEVARGDNECSPPSRVDAGELDPEKRIAPLPFDPAEFDDYEDFLRTVHEGGISPIGFNGRPRFPFGGSGHYARLLQGIHGPQGARRPTRASPGLKASEFGNAHAAVAYANYQGVILNAFTHITWSLQGLDEDGAVREAHHSFLELFRKWARYRSAPHAVVWVLERGRRRGLHSHILSYVPHDAYHHYHHWARKAVAQITRAPLVKRDSTAGQRDSTILPSLLRVERGTTLVDAQWTAFRYMMKDLSAQELAKVLQNQRCALLMKQFAEGRMGDGGLVVGQRSGVSRSIDEKARGTFDQDFRLARFARGTPELRYDIGFLAKGDVDRGLATLDI